MTTTAITARANMRLGNSIAKGNPGVTEMMRVVHEEGSVNRVADRGYDGTIVHYLAVETIGVGHLASVDEPTLVHRHETLQGFENLTVIGILYRINDLVLAGLGYVHETSDLNEGSEVLSINIRGVARLLPLLTKLPRDAASTDERNDLAFVWSSVRSRHGFPFGNDFLVHNLIGSLLSHAHCQEYAEPEGQGITRYQVGKGRGAVLGVKLSFLFFGLQEGFFLFSRRIRLRIVLLLGHFLLLR